MNLAKQLYEISRTQSQSMFEDFEEGVKDHPEKALLCKCAKEAKKGKTSIILGSNILPPESLKDEGFYLSLTVAGVKYCWKQ